MPQVVEKEFIFVDESGDPGLIGDPIYLLVGMHLSASTLDRVRRHLTAFRYHHDVVKEFKAQRWANKLTQPADRLLQFLAELTEAGEITATCNWLRKDIYRSGGGPYISQPGETWKFRHYQLRRLLERHRTRKSWSTELDLVIDRWKMPIEQRKNLEDYLRGNYSLRPVIASITLVDSAYADPIQIVDVYGRLARRRVTSVGSPEEVTVCDRLMDQSELTGGLR